jgi:antitoxin component of RelBE/YafQ-DinJ toxin-antitoxin module
MPNHVIFDYDRVSKILFVEDHWDIKTKQDVDEFFAQYDRQMKLIGERFWMVAHIDGLTIHAEIAEYYGEAARRATNELLLGLARWGTDSVVRMSLRTTAMKSKMPINIYSSREEALRAIEKMKAEGAQK